MATVPCPYCSATATATRTHEDATEFMCPSCGTAHTRKAGSPDAFAFFPADVQNALCDAEPLFPHEVPA